MNSLVNVIQSCMVISRITYDQIIRSKKTIFILIVAFLPVFLTGYYRISVNVVFLNADQVLNRMASFFLLFLSPFVALFYGTSLIADEVENKTITYLLTRPVQKYMITIGKFLAYFLVALIIVFPPTIITYLMLINDYRMPLVFSDILHLLIKQLGITTLSIIVYGSIFNFFGTRFKHPIISGLLFAFGWEKIVLIVPGVVRNFSVVHYIVSIFPNAMDVNKEFVMLGMRQMLQVNLSSGTFSIIILFVITVIFWGLSIYTIYNKEFNFE